MSVVLCRRQWRGCGADNNVVLKYLNLNMNIAPVAASHLGVQYIYVVQPLTSSNVDSAERIAHVSKCWFVVVVQGLCHCKQTCFSACYQQMSLLSCTVQHNPDRI